MEVIQIARTLKDYPATFIHPRKWIRMFEVLAKPVTQTLIHPDKDFVGDPDVVLLHAINFRPWMVDKARKAWPGVPLVGISYNHLWYVNENGSSLQINQEIFDAFAECDLVFGVMPPNVDDPFDHWREMGHLIDDKIFQLRGHGRLIKILVARGGWSHRDVYWSDELKESMAFFAGDVHWVDGQRSSKEMAALFNKSRVAVCLREDGGPAYSVVEAALCGCIPIVSNCPAIRRHFKDGGAILADRNVKSIREAVADGLALSPSQRSCWITRNRNYFRGWTLNFQGKKIIKEIKTLLIEE